MSQGVKVLTNPVQSLGPMWWKERTNCKLSSDSHTHVRTCVHTHMHAKNCSSQEIKSNREGLVFSSGSAPAQGQSWFGLWLWASLQAACCLWCPKPASASYQLGSPQYSIQPTLGCGSAPRVLRAST